MAWQIAILAASHDEAAATIASEHQSPEARKTYPPLHTEHIKSVVKTLPCDASQGISVLARGAPTATDPAGSDLHFIITRIPIHAYKAAIRTRNARQALYDRAKQGNATEQNNAT